MSEIPMPAGEPYQPPRQSSGYGTCCKIGVVICVLLIIAMVVVAMVWMGGILSLFGGIINGGNGATYGERTLATDTSRNIDLFPTYYFGEVTVASTEVQTTIAPDIHFDVNVDTGTDSVTVTIHCAVYDCDQTTFDSLTWSELDSTYLYEEGNYTYSVLDHFNIHNYSDTYVWVIWFDASSKTSIWSVDIDVTLRYNW